MPVKPLPLNPNLEHLKRQARDLMRLHGTGDPLAAQRLREFHPRFAGERDTVILGASLKLSDAQMTIARERGFRSWTRLKEHVGRPTPLGDLSLPFHERIADPMLRRAVELCDAGDVDGLRLHLKAHPRLTRERAFFEGGNYFQTPTLLEFIAENPVRRGVVPEKVLQVAEVILDAGVERAALRETLKLVATGSVVRECGVQVALIDLLCDRGADSGEALHGAALHGEWQAVEALLRRGARLDLPVAAALGRLEDLDRLLAASGPHERHLALSLAAQFGHAAVVERLLDAGEDPDRYNPVGGHSHSTPLHQAALAGHEGTVRLLVERGARLDMRDTMWDGTPADWAKHEGHLQVEASLREEEARRAQGKRDGRPDKI